jgi:hypothetical protein
MARRLQVTVIQTERSRGCHTRRVMHTSHPACDGIVTDLSIGPAHSTGRCALVTVPSPRLAAFLSFLVFLPSSITSHLSVRSTIRKSRVSAIRCFKNVTIQSCCNVSKKPFISTTSNQLTLRVLKRILSIIT